MSFSAVILEGFRINIENYAMRKTGKKLVSDIVGGAEGIGALEGLTDRWVFLQISVLTNTSVSGRVQIHIKKLTQ